MKNFWNNIEAVLEKLSPEMLKSLNKGVNDQDVKNLESQIGIKLPDDFVEFYKIHNGQEDNIGGLIEGEELLSFERILDEWKIWKDLFDSGSFCGSDGTPYDSDADTGIKPMWWNPLWIPFTYDGSGNHYCLDLDPDEGGNYGQVIRMWHDASERTLHAVSFTDFINEFADDLKAGNFEFEEYSGLIRKY